MNGSLRERALWLAVLPVLVASSEGAQALLDRSTTASYRGAELLASSHVGALLLTAGVGVILVGCGFVGHVASGCRERAVSRWMFALVPLMLFVVQEHVEYWVGHGGLTGSPATQSVFLLGLALQAPFAVAAYVAARLLMRLARAIAERRRPDEFASETRTPPALRGRDQSPRPIRLGGSRITRGPPALSVDSF